jgi:hypothetical protein
MNARKNRRVSRGAILVLILAALILLLLFLGHGMCGLGKGEGDGDGNGGDQTTAPEATPQRAAGVPDRDDEPTAADARAAACRLRIESDGTIHAGDQAVELDAAVAHCAGAGEAIVTAAGDAPFGALQDLRAALEKAGLRVRTDR